MYLISLATFLICLSNCFYNCSGCIPYFVLSNQTGVSLSTYYPASTTVADCQSACLLMETCQGVDWNYVKNQCFLCLPPLGQRNNGTQINFSHYDLYYICTSTTEAGLVTTKTFSSTELPTTSSKVVPSNSTVANATSSSASTPPAAAATLSVSGSGSLSIIGLVVGLTVGLAAIIIVIILIWRRRDRIKSWLNGSSENATNTDNQQSPSNNQRRPSKNPDPDDWKSA